jgi:hypothetical protein
MNRKHILTFFLLTSILLFVSALTQNTYRAGGDDVSGFTCLIVGWMGVPIGGTWANITWLANPVLVLAWIGFISDRKSSLVFSIIAFCLSLSFLGCKEITQNAAGSSSVINGYHTGYWLWLSSSLILIFGNIVLLKIEKQNRK